MIANDIIIHHKPNDEDVNNLGHHTFSMSIFNLIFNTCHKYGLSYNILKYLIHKNCWQIQAIGINSVAYTDVP